ncbi:MAG: hypothetical protein HOV83_04620 [Catenulispora sp.]|nr:hypothetical protein [Catenulispora sp.]
MKRIVLYDASALDRPTREDLHRLARLRLEARRSGCDLVLTGVGQRLRLLLTVTGLDELFTISPERTDPAGHDRTAGHDGSAEKWEATGSADPAETDD